MEVGPGSRRKDIQQRPSESEASESGLGMVATIQTSPALLLIFVAARIAPITSQTRDMVIDGRWVAYEY